MGKRMTVEPYITFQSITKTFGGVVALERVSFSIAQGECHALIGENGAGKSTLGKILAGIHRPDSGHIVIAGQPRPWSSPGAAARAGIGMVHQELAFCPDLSVAENLSLGHYPGRWGLLDRRAMLRQAEQRLAEIGVTLDVTQPMRLLSPAQEQLVQIAAAVGTGAEILVFDEPTSSLSESDAQRLFELIEALRRRGVTMIYVSHRLPEVFRLADRTTVLRDGHYVATVARGATTEDELVRLMVGRPLAEYFPRHLQAQPGPVVLDVRHLRSRGKCHDVSFTVRAGEIVGLAGLVGSGRSEVARAVFGLDSALGGSVSVAGRALRLGSVGAAMRQGVGLVPEDRKRQGLVLMLSGRENFSLATLDQFQRFGRLDHDRERRATEEFFRRLAVKTPSVETAVAAFSGGNQQKVVMAKWLVRKLKVLIVDEPTRGVDVGAKAALHALIDELARQGLAVLLISSELPEVLHLSTRILVMRGGRMVGEVPRAEATQERLLALMAGVGG